MNPEAKISIAAYFRDLGGTGRTRVYVLPFMPDVLRLATKSNFDQKLIPLTSSQLLIYKGSPPQNVVFTVKLVAGVDDIAVDSETNPNSIPKSRFGKLMDLCKQLHALSQPEDSSPALGAPPPKVILTIGAMLRASGAMGDVEVNYTGPYDEYGMSGEAEVTFTFLPSQFYDPRNRVGIFLGQQGQTTTAAFSQVTGAIARAEGTQQGGPSAVEDQQTLSSLDKLLTTGPSGVNALDASVPYIVSWGRS